MTFDIGLHEVCVRTGVRYVITKFSRMDSLPNFLTHGAPLETTRDHSLNDMLSPVVLRIQLRSLFLLMLKLIRDQIQVSMIMVRDLMLSIT